MKIIKAALFTQQGNTRLLFAYFSFIFSSSSSKKYKTLILEPNFAVMLLMFFFSSSSRLTVPPYLYEELTSSDTDAREGSDVSLRCMAKGSPEPEVTWRREDGQEISVGKSKGENAALSKAGRVV